MPLLDSLSRQLLDRPRWRAEDLGAPLPATPHAVSVCLPTWRDNVGYEENDPRVHGRLTTGYPRFVYNALCRELFAVCRQRFGGAGESALAFPDRSAAERFTEFLAARAGAAATLHEFGRHGVWAATFPEAAAETARAFWQHTGDGVSSRHAEACLQNRDAVDAAPARAAVVERIAAAADADPRDVFLFPCGMNAMYAVHRALCRMNPARPTVQFGFPYVDSLKIQEKFGAGVRLFPRGDAAELAELEAMLHRQPIAGLFTEFPSNPLLRTPDLERLERLARYYEFPLIVDDTIAGFTNVDVLPACDAVTTSLTKSFSGVGNVTAGSVVLSAAGPFHSELSAALGADGPATIWGEDLLVLEENSRRFAERIAACSAGAAALAEFLHARPEVAAVFYPRYETSGEYDAFRRPGGGYGPLFSVLLENPEHNAPRFFDALRISKGPNLGTNYTLACPYTILAHYRELDFAERHGVSRWLIRVSVGLEPPDDLIGRVEQALDAL